MKYKISEELLNKILAYLGVGQFKDVAGLVQEIQLEVREQTNATVPIVQPEKKSK